MSKLLTHSETVLFKMLSQADVAHVTPTDPDSIAITVVPSYRQAFVSWNTKSQKECSGAVQSYTVNYYKTQDVLYLSEYATHLCEVCTLSYNATFIAFL